MLDHKLHAESNFYLTDKLVGASGFNFADSSSLDRINKYYHASLFGLGALSSRQGPGKRCILNSVQCHDDDEDYEMTDEEAWLSPAQNPWFLSILQNMGVLSCRGHPERQVQEKTHSTSWRWNPF